MCCEIYYRLLVLKMEKKSEELRNMDGLGNVEKGH
ncbi:hCG2038925, isoform CRA_a [Homo sapiens]